MYIPYDVYVRFYRCYILQLCYNIIILCCCCLVAKLYPTLLQPHELQPTRLFCPWDSPGKNTGMSCHFHLQGIFSTQGSKPVSSALEERFFTTILNIYIQTSWSVKSRGPQEALLQTKLVEVIEFQLNFFKSQKMMLF